ncbi:MAG TPA: hypothetical protein VI957_03325 [Candidatus Paceibacterota bacterium]
MRFEQPTLEGRRDQVIFRTQVKNQERESALYNAIRAEAGKVASSITASLSASPVDFPAKVRINSDSREAFQAFRKWADRVSTPATEEDRIHPHKQSTFDFSKADFPRAFRKLLHISPGGRAPLIVVAGHTGGFSKALVEQGFPVMHTDADKRFATLENFPSLCAFAHAIPVIPNATAYVSFEGYPAFKGAHGYLTLLKSVAETQKGCVMMHGQRVFERNFFASLRYFSTFYNTHAGIYMPKNAEHVFFVLLSTPRARAKAVDDLKVLEKLQVGQMHLPAIAKNLSLTLNETRRSLVRIHMGFLSGKIYNGSHESAANELTFLAPSQDTRLPLLHQRSSSKGLSKDRLLLSGASPLFLK